MKPARQLLVVDDELDVREMLAVLLTRHGFEVRTAAGGMEALVLAQERLPDLILLDIMMHDMDGWEVLKLLQLDEATQRVPVVILSARAEPRDRIRGLQEGAVDYLAKPVAIEEVVARIESILGEGRAENP
ncbi:MAG: response regulator [Thermoanaerobaculia bacterium]|jgi:DNA-binding response OmpR family regulator|nr:response regulator [Thermoanaerobaculia bacterium]MBP7814389.1 response regulator [Thermoanaerobaculia bacterium]